MRSVLVLWCVVLGLGATACGSGQTEGTAVTEVTAVAEPGAVAEGTAVVEGTAVADPAPAPSADGTIVGIVTLRPSSGSAAFSDLCAVRGRGFEQEADDLLATTTAFAVFSSDGGQVDRVPFLASQLVGGSMEFGPVQGFFDEPPPPGSRDAVTLPLIDADLTIEIEGVAVSAPVPASDLRNLPTCTGTGAG